MGGDPGGLAPPPPLEEQLSNLEAASLSFAAKRQALVLVLLGVFTRLRRLTSVSSSLRQRWCLYEQTAVKTRSNTREAHPSSFSRPAQWTHTCDSCPRPRC